jgi:hypothetical protein
MRLISLLNLFVLVVALTFTPGCKPKWDPSQFDQAIMRIDNMVGAIDSATLQVGRTTEMLDALADKMTENGQKLIGEDLAKLSKKLSSDFGQIPKETIDFAEVKIKDNLHAFRAALAESRQDIVNAKAKRDAKGISRALDNLAAVKVLHDPVATMFIPSRIRIDWNSSSQSDGYKVPDPGIEIRGWGFERPKDEPTPFSITVIGADGRSRPLPDAALGTTTRYMMQLKLNEPSASFQPGDEWLVFMAGSGFEQKLPIVHHVPPLPQPEVPPPPIEMLEAVEILVITTGDNKEERGEVTLNLLYGGSEKIHTRGPFGSGQNWEKGHVANNYDSKPEEFGPVSLMRHVAFKSGEKVTLRIDLATTVPNRQVSWDGQFKVRFRTTKGRVLEFLTDSLNFDTGDGPGSHAFDCILPKPE